MTIFATLCRKSSGVEEMLTRSFWAKLLLVACTALFLLSLASLVCVHHHSHKHEHEHEHADSHALVEARTNSSLAVLEPSKPQKQPSGDKHSSSNSHSNSHSHELVSPKHKNMQQQPVKEVKSEHHKKDHKGKRPTPKFHTALLEGLSLATMAVSALGIYAGFTESRRAAKYLLVSVVACCTGALIVILVATFAGCSSNLHMGNSTVPGAVNASFDGTRAPPQHHLSHRHCHLRTAVAAPLGMFIIAAALIWLAERVLHAPDSPATALVVGVEAKNVADNVDKLPCCADVDTPKDGVVVTA